MRSCNSEAFQSKAVFVSLYDLLALINAILDYAKVSYFLCCWAAATYLFARLPILTGAATAVS